MNKQPHLDAVAATLRAALNIMGARRKGPGRKGGINALAGHLGVRWITVKNWTGNARLVPAWALLEMQAIVDDEQRRNQCPNCKIGMRAHTAAPGDTCQRCGYRLHLPHHPR